MSLESLVETFRTNKVVRTLHTAKHYAFRYGRILAASALIGAGIHNQNLPPPTPNPNITREEKVELLHRTYKEIGLLGLGSLALVMARRKKKNPLEAVGDYVAHHPNRTALATSFIHGLPLCHLWYSYPHFTFPGIILASAGLGFATSSVVHNFSQFRKPRAWNYLRSLVYEPFVKHPEVFKKLQGIRIHEAAFLEHYAFKRDGNVVHIDNQLRSIARSQPTWASYVALDYLHPKKTQAIQWHTQQGNYQKAVEAVRALEESQKIPVLSALYLMHLRTAWVEKKHLDVKGLAELVENTTFDDILAKEWGEGLENMFSQGLMMEPLGEGTAEMFSHDLLRRDVIAKRTTKEVAEQEARLHRMTRRAVQEATFQAAEPLFSLPHNDAWYLGLQFIKGCSLYDTIEREPYEQAAKFLAEIHGCIHEGERRDYRTITEQRLQGTTYEPILSTSSWNTLWKHLRWDHVTVKDPHGMNWIWKEPFLTEIDFALKGKDNYGLELARLTDQSADTHPEATVRTYAHARGLIEQPVLDTWMHGRIPVGLNNLVLNVPGTIGSPEQKARSRQAVQEASEALGYKDISRLVA